jgi:2-oxoisovalerate dehydrogenase E2 component (dihydrolipoyl transacylase)
VNTFLLPDLGEGLTEAEIVRWLVAEGDEVAVDQAVVEVETAKSVVELPSPYAGRVAALHGAEGAAVDVGKPLFSVEPASASGNVLVGYGTSSGAQDGRRRRPRTSARAAASPTPVGGGSPSAEAAATPTPALGGSETRPGLRHVPAAVHRSPRQPVKVTSPLVRKLARDGGVDVREIQGTGPDGLVTRADVVRALSGGRERRIPLTGFRKAVSATLTRSRAEIPEATVWVDVDATELWRLREGTRTPDDPGPGILAYLARFTVEALRRHPVFNSQVEGDHIVEHDDINLAIATQTPRGLVVPAVAGAQHLTLAALDAEIRRITAEAREGRAGAPVAGTFTLNNYGGFNVDGSAAIINHPQVAILGFGRMLDRPWVVDGEITVRRITQMSFVFDHRVADGGEAAAFMRDVADAIENPLPAIVRW